MKATSHWILADILGATLIGGSAPAMAADDGHKNDGPEAVIDLLFVRPFLLAQTAVGAGLFVISAPFTMANGNVGEAADSLVTKSAKKLFAPLGEGYSHDR